jgi:hypothetical protein
MISGCFRFLGFDSDSARVSIPLFEAELAAFGRAARASPTKQIVLVLDQPEWHTSVLINRHFTIIEKLEEAQLARWKSTATL